MPDYFYILFFIRREIKSYLLKLTHNVPPACRQTGKDKEMKCVPHKWNNEVNRCGKVGRKRKVESQESIVKIKNSFQLSSHKSNYRGRRHILVTIDYLLSTLSNNS